MTEQDQIRALAELDGDPHIKGEVDPSDFWTQNYLKRKTYLISHDAILPLVKKQPTKIQQLTCELLQRQQWFYLLCTPAQLCEALLRATGKWKE